MLSEIKISVLLPAYNAEKYVLTAVNSILAQTYRNFELLVADDASTDKTREILDNINDVRLSCFHNSENMGKTATVEKLYAYASGDLVTIHDADDISLPERFAKQVRVFLENSDLGMCGTSFQSINEDGSKVLETVHMQGNYEQILVDINNGSQFHGPTMMIRKDVLDDLGQIYRPFFKNNYEDTDLAYRIVEKHLAFNLPDILFRYRILPDSLCRKNVDVWNRNLYQIVVFLAKERKENGVDSIDTGNLNVLYDYFEEITKIYKIDKSLIHREAASYFMYWNLYSRAIKESLISVIKNPIRIINLRTFIYCLRKSIIRK